MKFYLSSEKVGDQGEKLRDMVPVDNPRFGYVPNALDWHANKYWMEGYMEEDLQTLRDGGIEPEILNLKDYFGKPEALRKKVGELGGLWVSGGSAFVLRYAMKASGLDIL